MRLPTHTANILQLGNDPIELPLQNGVFSVEKLGHTDCLSRFITKYSEALEDSDNGLKSRG